MKIDYKKIRAIDLSHLVEYITKEHHQKTIVGEAGEHHYKLLAYIATQLNDGYIVELGTHIGTSAMALSVNPKISVITFDIKDIWSATHTPKNVDRRIGNIFDLGMEGILLNTPFIFLDTAHRGDFEKRVYDYLAVNDYKGIMLCDDIHYNRFMRDFWESVTTLKYDITDIGHSYSPDQPMSGTGLIDFGRNVKFKNHE